MQLLKLQVNGIALVLTGGWRVEAVHNCVYRTIILGQVCYTAFIAY